MRNNFTKEDLKTGMVCLHRSGNYSMVIKDTFEREDNVVFAPNSRTGLDSFDNLTFKWNIFLGRTEKQTPHMQSVDIVKIYQPFNVCEGFIIFSKASRDFIESEISSWKVLWEEEQPIEMTMEDICKALGKNVKIVE